MSNTDFLSLCRSDDTARLYGDDTLQRFRKAHVCVVGMGGVGSWVVEVLVRTGIGRLALIDLGNAAKSSVNRQLHALIDDFDKLKVTALHERALQINSQYEVEEIEDSVNEDNLETLFRRPFNSAIDAVDQVRVKTVMAVYFVCSGRPFTISGNAGGQRNPALTRTTDLSKVAHDPLLASLCYTLCRHYGFSRDTKEKVRVPRVYSAESIMPPQPGGACTVDTSPQRLLCMGYGASMLVTAALGPYCAQTAVGAVAAGARPSESIGKGKAR